LNFHKELNLRYIWSAGTKSSKLTITNCDVIINHPSGKIKLKIEFKKTSAEPNGTTNGDSILTINNKKVAQDKMKTQPGKFGLGTNITIGTGGMDPVTKSYTDKFPFTDGTIKHVKIDVKGEPHVDPKKETERAMKKD